jgi:hypothetical protein
MGFMFGAAMFSFSFSAGKLGHSFRNDNICHSNKLLKSTSEHALRQLLLTVQLVFLKHLDAAAVLRESLTLAGEIV